MTDKTVAMQASDLFTVHANFKEQDSSSNTLLDFASVSDANGDVGGGCETAGSNSRVEYTNRFQYCGTAIVSDAGTLLSTFGAVSNSIAITEISVTFRQDAYPELAITGHQHTANAHAAGLPTFDVSGVIPGSTGGEGCPDIWSNADTDSTPISVTVRFSLTHTDVNDANNAHWVGTNSNARTDVTAEYLGAPSLTTTTWKIDSSNATDSNTAFDGLSIAAHKFFTRA